MASVPAVVCIDIVVVIVAARSVGALFRRFGQPSVVGEIVAGILLGPSVLGWFPGHLTTHLFPTDVRTSLGVLAQIGVVLFMFIVGLEVDFTLLRGRRRRVGGISLATVAIPFGLGVAFATYLYSRYPTDAHHLGFDLFIGATLSVTAFPVLAHILSERRMMTTDLGALALACAAADDLAAWTLLAVVVAVVQAKGGNNLPLMLLELAGFVAFMQLIGRPVLRRLIDRSGSGTMSMTTLAIVLGAVLASAWVTSEIGIDLIFGGFICGACFPKDRPKVVAAIVERIESVTLLLLLPLFFVVAGLSVNVRTIGVRGLIDLLGLLAVAIGGKMGGAALSARLSGITTRRSLALGVLMNTRGLTELVILSVGLRLGVLDTRLFTLLVIMAVVTTIATGPLFRAIYPDRMLQADVAEGERRAAGADHYEVVVVLDDRAEQTRLLAIGSDLAGPGGEVTLVRFLAARGPSTYAGGSPELMAMAAAMEELGHLAATMPGSRIRPMALFSADAKAEVQSLARRREIDALVLPAVGWHDTTLEMLAIDADCDVAVYEGAVTDDRSVTVMVERDRDSETAFELGVRIALGRAGQRSEPSADGQVPSALRLVTDGSGEVGYWRRAAGRLRGLGLDDVAVAEAAGGQTLDRSPGSQPLVVLGAGRTEHAGRAAVIGRATSVLRVYGHDDPQRVGLDQRFLRLSAIALPAPGAREPGVPAPPSTSADPAAQIGVKGEER